MHVNALSFFLLLIAREIWTWSQQSRGFVKHKRTPGFYHTMPVKRAVQPFSCWSYCAAVTRLLRTSCCRHWSSTCKKHWHIELFRRSWAWGSARFLCGELRYFLCLYLSHYTPCKCVTNFCLLTSICSAIFTWGLFSQYDESPCFLSSKTTSSKLAVRLWWAVLSGSLAGVWVSHTMALSLLSWWLVSGQPHLFKSQPSWDHSAGGEGALFDYKLTGNLAVSN